MCPLKKFFLALCREFLSYVLKLSKFLFLFLHRAEFHGNEYSSNLCTTPSLNYKCESKNNLKVCNCLYTFVAKLCTKLAWICAITKTNFGRAPPGPFFLYFHAVFRKIGPNNRRLLGLAFPWEIPWIRLLEAHSVPYIHQCCNYTPLLNIIMNYKTK